MVETKKVTVRVKKRKLKIKKILIILLIILVMVLAFLFVKDLPIKNIYIIGNNILSDREIIDKAGLTDYPSFIGTSKKNIESSLKNSEYIKEVKVKKRFYNKIYIYVTEYKALCISQDKLILESKKEIENVKNITYVPILTNDITDVYDKFIEKFSLINDDILLKISEIEYAPNNVDKERFLFHMNDDNDVYITLSKIEKINVYNSIYSSMEGKKGIIYLDLGDYIELK